MKPGRALLFATVAALSILWPLTSAVRYNQNDAPQGRALMPAGVWGDGRFLYFSDAGDHTIERVELKTNTVTPVAGSSGHPGTEDGTGPEARFNSPRGMWGDGRFLYVADGFNHAIRSVELSTGIVHTIAGKSGSAGATDGVGIAARFYFPRDVWGGDGNLYVADSLNHSIRKLDLVTGQVTTMAGALGKPGTSGGIGAEARFHGPVSLWGSNGTLYVADWFNEAVRTVDLKTARVSDIEQLRNLPAGGTTLAKHRAAGIWANGSDVYLITHLNYGTTFSEVTRADQKLWDGEFGFTFVNGTMRLSVVSDLWGDSSNVFLASPASHSIIRMSLAGGQVSTVAGSPGMPGSGDGESMAARFASPEGIWMDDSLTETARRFVFVADTGNHTIRKMDVKTREVSTLAGLAGVAGSIDGRGDQARFHSPKGIWGDTKHKLIVADTGNHTLRTVTLETGEVTTLAGVAGESGTQDGPRGIARFNKPSSVCVWGAAAYVADSNNHAIRGVSLGTGQVFTVAGSPSSAGWVDGFGADARFNSPTTISCGDPMLVWDSGNGKIRQITFANGKVSVTTFATWPASDRPVYGRPEPAMRPRGGMAVLYFADPAGHTIRALNTVDRSSVIFAGALGQPGDASGDLRLARFRSPSGLAPSSVLPITYITDTGNHVIRKLTLAGGEMSVLELKYAH